MGSLRLSFCLSILVHVIVLGLILLARFGVAKSAPEREESWVTLALVNAPEEATVDAVSPAPLASRPVVSSPPAAPSAPVLPPEPVSRPLEMAAESFETTAQSPPPPPNDLPRHIESPYSPVPFTTAAEGDDPISAEPGVVSPNSQVRSSERIDPTYLDYPEPPFPLAAQRRRQEGVVLLTVRVSAQGRATRVDLTQSSGFAILDEAAEAAVRRWVFEPARLDSQAVAADITVPVHFKLRR